MKTTTRWLRLEALTVLAAALVTYGSLGASWWLFALFLLAPDLAMVGYLAGPGTGALTYNLAHLYAWPALLAVAGLLLPMGWALPAALIWAAHIAMDRALGYGLKEPDAFQHTHLGWIGARTAPAAEGVPGAGSPRGRR